MPRAESEGPNKELIRPHKTKNSRVRRNNFFCVAYEVPAAAVKLHIQKAKLSG